MSEQRTSSTTEPKVRGERVPRRGFLRQMGGLAAATGAAVLAQSATGGGAAHAQARRNTYVLVHGAWHGGWCWQRVTPLLAAQGHAVHTPTLTGLGDRAHLASGDVNLDTHIQDIVALLDMEDLNDVTLVGHSSSGFAITGAADRAKARLRNLIYLDAWVPENGKSLADYLPPDRQFPFLRGGIAQGSFPFFPVPAFGIRDPKDIEWVKARLVNQPFFAQVQPLKLTNPPGNGLPRSFIYCSQPAMGPFDHFAQMAKGDPAWKFREMKTGHDAMITDPTGLVAHLLELA
jgi:pimeloyl-ACP methyl ester carboxylesterase